MNIKPIATFEEKKLTDPPGFEPGSEAPEASILSRLYYESIIRYAWPP
jgi:hypothetical protein